MVTTVVNAASSIRRFDAYAKTIDDFRIRTPSGGVVTLLSALVIFVLLVSEWIDFIRPTLQARLEVDKERKERMDIYLNITFPYLPCGILSLDVMDVSGDHQNEIAHNVYKVRIDQRGMPVPSTPIKEPVGSRQMGTGDDKKDASAASSANASGELKPQLSPSYCGPCYGARDGCCNTCQEVQDAYAVKQWSFRDPENMEQCVREGYVQAMKEQATEGCIFHGHFAVNKVPGNFHFAPGRSYEKARFHIHDISAIPKRTFDFSHRITHLSFGNVVGAMVNPLDNTIKDLAHDKMFMVQNFIKVVGTRYFYLNGMAEITNQYSVTEFMRDVTEDVLTQQNTIPGVFFHYEISPMVVVHTESRKSWSYFLTSLCAVVGGVFTVSSLIDAALYRATWSLQRKMQLGKQG